jgi:hypothetical protein
MYQTTPRANRQTCSRCVCDDTFPNIEFDDQGVCNFCDLHGYMDQLIPNGLKGERILEAKVASIKRRNRKAAFDCIVGVSGGRDSTYCLLWAKRMGLRPLAVHFNDGFGNPVAGENMTKATSELDVPIRIVTSDWRESKDLKIACLKASTPELEQGTDLGIASALYGEAAKEGIKDIILGHSFRTEGISPLEWNYMDGHYLKSVHDKFGSHPLRPWRPEDPGFNLRLPHMFYYAVVRRIRSHTVLDHMQYVRADVTQAIEQNLGWVNPGAHYFDDLYQSLYTYVLRRKFGIDRRKFAYSALVRSGQMSREVALERISKTYEIEDPEVISLCVKRLGLSDVELEEILQLPPKSFHDYPNVYKWIRKAKWLVVLLEKMGLIPSIATVKYFRT